MVGWLIKQSESPGKEVALATLPAFEACCHPSEVLSMCRHNFIVLPSAVDDTTLRIGLYLSSR